MGMDNDAIKINASVFLFAGLLSEGICVIFARRLWVFFFFSDIRGEGERGKRKEVV